MHHTRKKQKVREKRKKETKDQPVMLKYLLLFDLVVEHFLPIYLAFHGQFESLHKRNRNMSNLVKN
jgi:hypothetical protein